MIVGVNYCHNNHKYLASHNHTFYGTYRILLTHNCVCYVSFWLAHQQHTHLPPSPPPPPSCLPSATMSLALLLLILLSILLVSYCTLSFILNDVSLVLHNLIVGNPLSQAGFTCMRAHIKQKGKVIAKDEHIVQVQIPIILGLFRQIQIHPDSAEKWNSFSSPATHYPKQVTKIRSDLSYVDSSSLDRQNLECNSSIIDTNVLEIRYMEKYSILNCK